jgi:hypothetical protein
MPTWKISLDAEPVPYALRVFPLGSADAVLTTDRAESSQGLPVVVYEGAAYGPADLGAHLLYVDDPAGHAAAHAAGYSVAPLPARFVGPRDEDCTDIGGGHLTY